MTNQSRATLAMTLRQRLHAKKLAARINKCTG
jgi:hypothetical protein